MNAHDLATKPQLISRDGPRKSRPTEEEMQSRFHAYDVESTMFLCSGEWLGMTWAQREDRQAEIDAHHGYKHGWIIVNGYSFDRRMAFPNIAFDNVWD